MATPPTATCPHCGDRLRGVRLPRESLEQKEANCIDGTVLFASLLEAISMSPALVMVPGHAFLAWETWRGNGHWRYLETTMIGSDEFDVARARGESLAQTYSSQPQQPGVHALFRRWPLRELRSERGVFPME